MTRTTPAETSCRLAVIAGTLLAAVLPASSLDAQGWIEPPPLAGGFAVDRVRSEVDVMVEGSLAHVTVSEWFVNDGARVAEGDYLYPIPGEAVFEDFSLYLGEEELRGEIMDADEAREIYESIVRRRKDPALIEYHGHGLLRARVFPIGPGDERKVTIRYVQRLARSGSGYRLVHAGALRGGSPGFAMPGSGSGTRDEPGAGRADREDVELRPLPEPVDASFHIRVEDEERFHDPFSPTHELDVERRGGDLFVNVNDFSAGKLALFLPLADEYVGVTVATHHPTTEAGYFMLTLSPGSTDAESIPRDVTAVLDISGSMAGPKIEQARGALVQLLHSLGPDDRFRLVAFSNRVMTNSNDWEPWSRAATDRARDWIAGLMANGGTDIGGALDEALRIVSPEDRLPVVVFLTDGLPTNGETSPARIADRVEGKVGRTRIFSFGVGYDVNTHLLDRLGEAGRGATDYVAPGENVERAVGELARRVSHPALTDLEVNVSSVEFADSYPARLPDLFLGQELVLFGRFSGSGPASVSIAGRRGQEELEFETEFVFPEAEPANGFIPRLWAARKLGHLERRMWTEGETPELLEEIRALALRYGLPSRYTSYLVREPGVVVTDAPIDPDWRTMLPGGVPRTPGAARGSDATGQAAVEAAGRATEMMTLNNLVVMSAAVESHALPGFAGTARRVGGRSFVEEDGVWMDVHHAEDVESVTIVHFSDAWFALVRDLPEILPVLKELTEVTIAGVGVSLRFTESALDRPELDPSEVAAVVRAFREGG